MSSIIAFNIGGKAHEIPLALWDSLLGPKPALGFECDGCTASPDHVFGKCIVPACVIHDYHQRTEAAVHRIIGNATFRINVWKCLRWGPNPLPWLLAAKVTLAYTVGGSIGSWWAHGRS